MAGCGWVWLGVAGCGWVWLGVAGRVYLSSLPCYKEREVGEEKGLGGRFSHLPPPPS